mmetsp:Transcript_1780/g.2114  ORF Transcript_1780/g.2114 Transcript_1780/m.2114 type:complete len:586 (-) Transcript_1780:38-1795(-)
MGDRVHLEIDPDLYGDGYKDPFIQDEDKLSMAELIPRILIERLSFLNLTEESLEQEIARTENALIEDVKTNEEEIEDKDIENEEALLHSDSTDDLIDTKNTFENFQKQKIELSKYINSALNETSLSLDFVSLLLSTVKPNIGRSTMSPHLSKSVPIGSLNSDRLSNNTDMSKYKNSAIIGQGWKLESLNKITNSFKNASLRLNEQVLKEKRYWDMINLVLGNHEILYKTRDPANGSRAIGVRYGYGDSGSNYYDRGLAILRKDNQTGEISFNPVSSANKITNKIYKYIRIKILSKIDDDYMLTGQSIFENNFINTSKYRIINDIEKARFFLFEEDLFYQLTREAKYLINYNVLIIANKIIIEINNEIIEIESIMYDENNEDELNNYYQNINQLSSINNKKAQSILTHLKLMLCCFYKYNLQLKQKIPTAVTKWKQSNSHPLILRPLLGHIRHEINVQNMLNILNSHLNEFKDKTKITIDYEKYINLKRAQEKILNPFIKSIEKPLSTFEVTINKLKDGQVLKIYIDLTSNEVFCTLIVNLNIIKFESSEKINDNQQGANVLLINFNDLGDLEECLNWTILNFINE